jgi:hypothetical protein
MGQTKYVLESSVTGDQTRAYFEHIAEKYLERALEEYDATKGSPSETRTIILMINSLADRFQMVANRSKA